MSEARRNDDLPPEGMAARWDVIDLYQAGGKVMVPLIKLEAHTVDGSGFSIWPLVWVAVFLSACWLAIGLVVGLLLG